jgi:hypothetical protein
VAGFATILASTAIAGLITVWYSGMQDHYTMKTIERDFIRKCSDIGLEEAAKVGTRESYTQP